MPDLYAGSRVLALDTPPAASDDDTTDELAFSNTSFAAGINATVGTAFIAPTSGRVLILWNARFEHNGTGIVLVSMGLRTGSTLGSGTVVAAAEDDWAITTNTATGGTDTRIGGCFFRPISGLTPGSTYNAITEHRVSTGNADIFNRALCVLPLP